MNLYTANGISLTSSTTLRAEVRPPELRQPEYETQYDYKTLIYDCFTVDSELVIVGPPLVNLEQDFFPIKILASPQPTRYQYFPLDRCYSIHLNWQEVYPNGKPAKLTIDDAYLESLDRNYIEVGEEVRIFDDKRVLYTHQKNNPLEWIVSWAEFYVKVHNTNAVLIYDNGSDAYSLESLYEALSSIAGLESLALVHWPYFFGPGGGWVKDGKPISFWDSDFCQLSALESAKKRFLGHAKSVISVDVDELIVPTQTECNSIHEFAEKSNSECIIVNGEFVSNATAQLESTQSEQFRHCNFKHTFAEPHLTSSKYCVVPAKSAIDSQWKVHTAGSNRKTQDSFLLRHFMAINTNWKNNRSKPCAIDPEKHSLDIYLDRIFQYYHLEPQLIDKANRDYVTPDR